MPIIPPEVYGPAGLLVVLSMIVWRLWRLHEMSDAKREALLDTLTAQLPELIASNKTLANTVAERLTEAVRPPPYEPGTTLTWRSRSKKAGPSDE